MNTTEEAIFKILFPPRGDTPTACLDAVPRMRIIIGELIALSHGESIAPNVGRRITCPGESGAITERIVELHQKHPDWTWEKVAEVLGLGISKNACRKRYEDWKKRNAVAEGVVSDIPTSVVHPAEPCRSDDWGSMKPSGVSEDSLDDGKIQLLKEGGKDTKEIATILSTEMGVEVPWQAVRAKPAHMARMRKSEAVAPEEDKPILAPEKLQNNNAPGTLTGQTSADPGDKPPQEARYPDPKPISRASLEAMMLELHEQGLAPDEISEEICRRGYPRSPGTVRAWLSRLGVKI